MDDFSFAIPLLIGFALGYGVREIISRYRHREAERRRQSQSAGQGIGRR
jgi:hypothetical protein